MPQEYGEDRLIFKLSSDDAIELDSLGEGFAGLARIFRRHLVDEGIDPDKAPAKLFVTDLKSGSVEFELATLAALYVYAQSAADGAVIWLDFYERVKGTLKYLAGRGGRPSKYTKEDAQDYDSFLRTITGKRGASLRVRRAKFQQKTKNREILAEFEFNESDVSHAGLTLVRDIADINALTHEDAGGSHKIEKKVPFIWHRTDREKGKEKGQTSDRGIVAKITDKPLPVFFASETDSKDRMVRIAENPFNRVYVVDVDVQYDESNEPKGYTILNIYDDHAA